MTSANELRGEVDLTLEGERFVMRPSWEAILEVEKITGKSVIKLASMAQDSEMTAGDAATCTTQFIKAWGKATGNQAHQAVNAERIGELIHEFGLMNVQLRLAIVLMMAATGGCKADGTPKEGEVTTTGTTTETPAVE